MLKVNNLKVSIGEVQILRGVDIEVPSGELHAIMGPNGSGKSTFCHALMGNPDYSQSGVVTVGETDISKLTQYERSAAGVFQSFQYPVGLPGVTLKEYINEINPELNDEEILELSKKFNVSNFLDRDVNVDLSGGEKKRSELFQLAVKKPKVALLDEIDSGLDIDGIRTVAKGINAAIRGTDSGALIITHYSRILEHVQPDKIHVLIAGKIVKTGGPELALELEEKGYDWLETGSEK